ncbi:MAG: hypothetical protein DRJ65_11760 [Acidobacteria bacterium]|nr:MAG: hypothetical protein DRJ65_11760 [Acidobacteriota bacterium]
MIKRLVPLILVTLSLCQIGVAATPSADLIKKIAAASGGMEAFEKLGVIRLEITEKDSFADGTDLSSSFTATLDTRLDNIRLEMGDGQIVIVSNGDNGWALIRGQLDERKQTLQMAPKVIRKKLLPWLLPFTLNLNGVYFPDSPSATTFAGKPALKAAFTVPDSFFDTPVMNTKWTAFLSKDDNRIVGAEFLPNEEYKEAMKEGMRYHITKATELKGVRIPTEINVTGIDAAGRTTQTKRTITIKATIVNEPSPALFLHPELLQAFEEDE